VAFVFHSTTNTALLFSKKGEKKYAYAKGVKRKGAKKTQVASPHHLFYSSHF